jgi:hypothetical protein
MMSPSEREKVSGPPLEDRFLGHVFHVHEQGLVESAQVDEGADVRLRDGATERLVHRTDRVLLVHESSRLHALLRDQASPR